MPGLSQVSQALAYRCAQLIYPQGLQAASLTGRQVVIRRGWLLPNDVFAAQGIRSQVDYVTVTMAPRNAQKLQEPLGRPWRVRRRVGATAEVARQDDGSVLVVFPAGVEPAGVVGVWDETGRSAVCAVTAGDTPSGVAQVLAEQLVAGGAAGAVAQGAAVVVPGVSLFGRVGGYGESVCTVRRQTQRFRLSVWTVDASVREILGDVVDTTLTEMSWLPLLDGGQAQIGFAGVEDVDTMQNEALFRRDYFYDIQFDTEQVVWSSDLMFGGGHFDQGASSGAWGTPVPVFDQAVVDHALTAMKSAETQQVSQSIYPGFTMDSFGTVISLTS